MGYYCISISTSPHCAHDVTYVHDGAQREQLEHGAAYEQTTEAAGECPTRRLPSCKCLVARLTCRTKLCYDRTVQAVHDHFLPFTWDHRVTYRLWPKLHVRLPTSDYTPSNRSTRPCRRTLRCIRTNLTTIAYIDGYTQETGDQCEISISVDC